LSATEYTKSYHFEINKIKILGRSTYSIPKPYPSRKGHPQPIPLGALIHIEIFSIGPTSLNMPLVVAAPAPTLKPGFDVSEPRNPGLERALGLESLLMSIKCQTNGKHTLTFYSHYHAYLWF